jgi:hypothetical protein
MRQRLRQGRKDEGGFALLVVFLLAAAVAFALYQELPRAAFESARDKEQILIDRGNQYKRAIEVYYAVNKRYPAELKDLENTNEKRYLRRRYKDPLTGDDQWRLIHTNGSALTDSLVQKPPAQNAANGTPANGTLAGGGPLGANNLNTAPAAPDANAATANATDATGAPVQTVNAAVSRRPSDRGFNPGGLTQPAGPPGANPFGAAPNGASPNNFDPNDPRTWPPITLATPTAPNGQPIPSGLVPGQQPNTQIIPGAVPSGIPGQLPGLGGANPQPPTFDPSNPAGFPVSNPLPGNNQPPNQISGTPGNSFNQLLNQQPVPPVPPQGTIPAQPPGAAAVQTQPPFFPPQPGVQPPAGSQPQAGPQPQVGGGGGNAATQFINNQLFSPTQTGTAPGTTTASAGPGIAGVASKHIGPSIKSYKKRTKYQEWEFVFEPSAQNPAQAAANPNAANPNQANPSQPNANPLGLTPFGPTTGQSTGPTMGQQPPTQPVAAPLP